MKLSTREKNILLKFHRQLKGSDRHVDANSVKEVMVRRGRTLNIEFLALLDKLYKNKLITWPFKSNMASGLLNGFNYPDGYDILMTNNLSEEYRDYYEKSYEHGLYFTDELIQMCENNFPEENNEVVQVLEKATEKHIEVTKDITNAIKNQTETQHADSIYSSETIKHGAENISSAIEDAHKEPKWKTCWKWFKEFAGLIAIILQITILIIQCNGNKNDRKKLENRIDTIETHIKTIEDNL
ncbi:MAG: hypothetical protein IJP65_03450 [Bacteroidales bacterium]|nr:hypothetical protein [Bacteroidales bacterium]